MSKRVILFIVLYLVWIPIGLWVSIQIGRLVDPEAAARSTPVVTILLVIVGLGVPGALGPYLLQRAPGWQKTVLAHGHGAPAVIRQMKNTRWGDRHNPFYQFTLEVQPPGEAPFVVTFEQSTDWKGRNWESRKPGETVYVQYDPQNKRHLVVIDRGPHYGPSQHPGAAHPPGQGHQPDQVHQPDQAHQPDKDHRPDQAPKPAAEAPTTDLAGELERLAKLRTDGQLTAEEYEAAKRKLLA